MQKLRCKKITLKLRIDNALNLYDLLLGVFLAYLSIFTNESEIT